MTDENNGNNGNNIGNNNSDELRYDIWVEAALRRVINNALDHVSKNGLPGDHHFYISFLTQDPGVLIPGRLLAQHPDEMTIVMQHQYDDLTVSEEGFGITLSFGGKKERLEIPYSSVISFSDPSVSFALQLKMVPLDGDDEEYDLDTMDLSMDSEVMDFEGASFSENNNIPVDAKKGDDKSGEVIALDTFRKK